MKSFREITTADIIRIKNRAGRATTSGEWPENKLQAMIDLLDRLEGLFEDPESVSYTKLKTFKTCPKKYEYKYVLGLTPKERVQKIELGKYCHELLDALGHDEPVAYASEAYWLEQTQNMFLEELAEFEEIRNAAEAIISKYQTYYANDTWEILEAEKCYKLLIQEANAVLKFIPDVVVRDQNGIKWLVDHKITSVDFTRWEDSLVLDEQANIYLWAYNQLHPEDPASGIIFNLIRSKLPAVPNLLKKGGLSKAKNIDTDVETYLQAIKDNDLDPEEYTDILEHIQEYAKPFFKRVMTYRTPDELEQIGLELVAAIQHMKQAQAPFYRNAGQHCQWGCSYRELCIMDVKNCDSTQYVEFAFDRREDMENDNGEGEEDGQATESVGE